MANNSSLKSTIAVSLTNYLDAGAIVAGASGLTLWQNYLGLTESHLGWLNSISANCFGAAIGAIIGGFLADKYGRKAIYTYNMIVYMLGVLLVMCSVNIYMLFAGFLITGISVGIGVPASWTYISESSEVNNRGRNICISQMSWGLGPMIILLLGALLAPGGALSGLVTSIAQLVAGNDINGDALNVFSSRIVFGSLFVVAFIAWNLQRRLGESQEWLAQKESERHSGMKAPGLLENIKVLFTNSVAVKTVAFLAVIYLSWNCVAGVNGFFMPHIFENAGLSNELSNWFNCAQWAVTVGVTFLTSLIIDRMSHKTIFTGGLVIAILAWVALLTMNGTMRLLTFSILWGVQSGLSVQIFYALWGTELFPAKFRAGAQGLMFFIVRGLSAVWSPIFTTIYGKDGSGFEVATYCMIVLLLISLVIGVIGCPNTRGKSLEQITKERYGE